MRRFASLRRQADFGRLRRSGRRVSSHLLTTYRGDAPAGASRSLVGITVSKAVGKAVVRNKLRRRLGALVHEALAGRQPMRLLFVPRPAAAAVPFADLRREVLTALGPPA
jgi:ribonuclease P protein component